MSWHTLLALILICVASGCTSLNTNVPRVPSYAFERPEETVLGRNFAEFLVNSPAQSGFRSLVSGEEAFIVRAATAEAAQKTLDLQYFIVANDATATLLLYRALQAAERDVRVRILVDDVGTSDNYDLLSTIDVHPNIEVRTYNPFSSQGLWGVFRVPEYLGNSSRLNRRMHNKLWIADNAVAVIGGRNLGDAYFAFNRSNNFADLDVFMAGPLVRDVSNSFDAYWNNATAVPIKVVSSAVSEPDELAAIQEQLKTRAEKFRYTHYAKALRDTDFRRLLRSGKLALQTAPAAVLQDSPEKNLTQGKEQPVIVAIRSTILSARREALLVSPYFVPSERGVTGLCSLAKKGVRVRILTNSLASTDVPIVHAGYARYRPRLLACGVELHELRPGVKSARKKLSLGTTLHAKVVIVDRSTLIVGSMNLDPRSRLLNTEVAVRIENSVMGEELSELFEEAVSSDQSYRVELTEPGNASSALVWVGEENKKTVRLDGEPMASVWRHFVSGLLGSMAPEELL
ncbi:MAG: phospholipase D family protein [Trichlorobacter sp.]|uniref:phospholipase D-like domain-containing protein n=1 Tax=Trichlorobacter sp. TaxID=2911007 RepID=UPI00256E4C66|nr:phospholipase D family protein [Trichlorobacter sp.]MDK9717654.1 phospholipase D family protein [Trichlorobacter sp.]